MSAEQFNVHFSMERWDDVDMHLSIGERTAKVYLSDAVFSFEWFIAWLKRIDFRQSVEPCLIDEEGPDKEIIVFDAEEPQIICFSIRDLGGSTVFLNGYIDRQQFISAFKDALSSFFTLGYIDEYEWRECDPEGFRNEMIKFFGEGRYREMYGDPGEFPLHKDFDESPSLRQRILADPWLRERGGKPCCP